MAFVGLLQIEFSWGETPQTPGLAPLRLSYERFLARWRQGPESLRMAFVGLLQVQLSWGETPQTPRARSAPTFV
jgi:hypothetical protein